MPVATVVAMLPALGAPAAVLAVICAWGFFQLRGSTLPAACAWGCLSSVCLAMGCLSATRLEGIYLSSFSFAMAATTFCPLMAVLGAKRPQDRGWQWIVLSLWLILIWPAGQAALLPAGVRLELFAAWKIFLWGLVGLGLLNYLPTRHWISALLVAAGQILLLREHLGSAEVVDTAVGWMAGIVCFLLAAMLIIWRSRRPALPCGDSDAGGDGRSAQRTLLAEFDQEWLSFRDSYGAFWALRILGRVNHAAELRGWPLVLQWGGFVIKEPLSDEQTTELRQTMETLLRRFVDTEEFFLRVDD